MTFEQVVSSVVSVLGLAGLAWLAFSVYPALIVEDFRQSLFDLRNRLFDEALDGAELDPAETIQLDDELYMRMRTIINGALSTAHSVTFVDFVTFVAGRAMMRQKGFDLVSPIDEVIDEVSEAKAKRYQEYVQEFSKKMLLLMADRSLFIRSMIAMIGLIARTFPSVADARKKAIERPKREYILGMLRRDHGVGLQLQMAA